MRMLATWLVLALVGLIPAAGQVRAGPDASVPDQAYAGLAQGDGFLVSTPGMREHGTPAVAYNDNLDQYLVVWADDRNAPGWPDIYGQLFSAEGAPLGDNLIVQAEAGNALVFPDVTYDTATGRYLVVWQDGTSYDIEGLVVADDGTIPWPSFTVADGTVGTPYSMPAVACYAHITSGMCVVVYLRGPFGEQDVYSRRVTSQGVLQGAEQAVAAGDGDQVAPDVAVNPEAGVDGSQFLIVWNNLNASPANIRCRLEDRDGGLGSNFTISSTATIDLYEPAVAFSPDAGEDGAWLVVFWQDVSDNTQIAGQRVAATGGAEGEPLDICTEAGNQFYPDLAYNAGSKEYLAIWADDRAGGDDLSIYGRRLDRLGQALGSSFRIGTASGSTVAPPMLPAVAASAEGYLAVYDTPALYVGGQLLAADGTLVGSELAIATPLKDQTRADVAYNSTAGQYLVVWQDDQGGDQDIWGQLVDQDGRLLLQPRIICDEAGNQGQPSVAYNPDADQYLVVWQDNRDGSLDIYGRRVNADGSLEGEEMIAGQGLRARTEPRVIYNPVVGEYLVVYTYAAGNDNILGRRIGADGTPAGDETPIATGQNEQQRPDIACRAREGQGGYLVIWRETNNGQRDVLGQRLKPDGTLLEGVLEISADETVNEWSPHLAYDPGSDSYLVVWPDDRDQATQGRNIYGRQVGGTGSLQDAFVISAASGDQKHVALTYAAGLDEFVVTWTDGRDSAIVLDIYGQRVAADGSLVETAADENELFFGFAGEQWLPAVAWGDQEISGLVLWQDKRNGEGYDIYGRRLRLPLRSVYLPFLVREE